MGTESEFALGDGRMMKCADDALLSFTLEICMAL